MHTLSHSFFTARIIRRGRRGGGVLDTTGRGLPGGALETVFIFFEIVIQDCNTKSYTAKINTQVQFLLRRRTGSFLSPGRRRSA